MVYQWRDGSTFAGDPQEVGETLDALRRANNGDLTAEQVVDVARAKRSVLHRYFEWDDTRAAMHYRRNRARGLIGAVEVIYTSIESAPKRPVRAFSSVKREGEKSAYRSTAEALESPSMRAAILEHARNELERWTRQYNRYRQLSAAIAHVDKAVLSLDQARSRRDRPARRPRQKEAAAS